jgi:hypothetical protein
MGAKLKDEYEKDFYAWTLHNAELMRAGKLSEIDVENVAEEIESMGRSDKRELINRLAVLIAHLLKWRYQPNRQSSSWKITIKRQRIDVTSLLTESPSLKHELDLKLTQAYTKAKLLALEDTGLDEKILPTKCPFTLDQCLNSDFFPESLID